MMSKYFLYIEVLKTIINIKYYKINTIFNIITLEILKFLISQKTFQRVSEFITDNYYIN